MGKHAQAVARQKQWQSAVSHPIFTWTSKRELAWLAEQAAQHKCIVELGSYHGASAFTMASVMPKDARLYCVDNWIDPDAEARFKRNLAPFPNVVQIKATSWEGAKLVPELKGKIDMLFIDAGHQQHEVANDLNAWVPLCAPGALICGHDYYHKAGDDAVKKAVHAFYKGPVNLPCDSIWNYVL